MPVKRQPLYSLRLAGGLSSFSPVDATPYFWGAYAANWSTASGKDKLYFPKRGVIRAANVITYASAAIGTAEAWAMYIRLNNASDTLIATVANADRTKIWLNEDLNIQVLPTDYIEIKTTTPTWATNPTGVSSWGHILVG